MIPFNKPFIIGNEINYIQDAVASGKISGDGMFSKKCQSLFEERYGFHRTLLTTSCTDALEMAAILCDIEPGDEVIAPSYAFTSTVNAFVLRGARIIFADSNALNPNIDGEKLESLITNRTKAIVVIHYAGIACDMETIMDVAQHSDVQVIEDAAQAIASYYNGQPLGSFGALSAFSFHETKNIISGEGGLLIVNDPALVNRAEIIREKGTNRAAFFRGEVDKYGWVDIGSSFLPSEIVSAFLYAQLEHIDEIQAKRIRIWDEYYQRLAKLEEQGHLQLPNLPGYASNNGHMFYVVCKSNAARTKLIEHLKSREIMAVFHYQSLHNSEYYKSRHDGRKLEYADRYTDTLLRLPLYYDLSLAQVRAICEVICEFFS